jgi:hypothetical protein
MFQQQRLAPTFFVDADSDSISLEVNSTFTRISSAHSQIPKNYNSMECCTDAVVVCDAISATQDKHGLLTDSNDRPITPTARSLYQCTRQI